MATRIPMGTYRQIANAGHDLHLDQPEAWRAIVSEFLQELSGTESRRASVVPVTAAPLVAVHVHLLGKPVLSRVLLGAVSIEIKF